MSEMEDEGQATRSTRNGSAQPMSKELARDAAAELMGLEKRLPRTVFLLVSRPGMATLEYCRGARNEQVSPVPFFAVCLRSMNDPSIPYAEYLVFALYFQSVLLMAVLALRLSPLDGTATSLLGLGYIVAYVGLSARRLWGLGVLGALWLATASLIAYVIGVFVAGLGATLLYNWLF